MKTVLQALIGWFVNWLMGWFTRRKATKQDAAASAARDAALKESQTMRDSADASIEKSHEESDVDRNRVDSDANAGAEQLRKQSDDVQRAIDSANN